MEGQKERVRVQLMATQWAQERATLMDSPTDSSMEIESVMSRAESLEIERVLSTEPPLAESLASSMERHSAPLKVQWLEMERVRVRERHSELLRVQWLGIERVHSMEGQMDFLTVIAKE
jgi:hypothetical protein